MFSKFRRRSSELEHIDLGDYTAEEYEGCLRELRTVNRWLGDARALRTTLLPAIRESQLKTFSLIDVGAGSGELLRTIAEWAKPGRRDAQLTGVELNARSARAITEQSTTFRINAVQANAFTLPFSDNQFDYAICSLFLHHFQNEQAVEILRELNRVARREVFVIDLHRHPIAYYFYITVGKMVFHNRLTREDGALSILRGFKPAELINLARQSDLKSVNVVRRFPYRLVLTAKKELLPLHQHANEQLVRLAS
ncbi:MAG TPA: methyltransferase domain-containing protein [Pyrinomonadaceae bacterium]|nr:methyltransferase domain-containing protein [Pyrinomonadaceae bacterium]